MLKTNNILKKLDITINVQNLKQMDCMCMFLAFESAAKHVKLTK